MDLVQLIDVSLSFGSEPLLDNASLSITDGEHLCLLGRNGTGKTSLLKLIANQIQADDGVVKRHSDLTISLLPQAVPEAVEISAREYVADAFQSALAMIDEYQQLSSLKNPSGVQSRQMEQLQNVIEDKGYWHIDQSVTQILDRLSLQPDVIVAHLSGGNRRMLSLARALVVKPDLLLLDEPTNHLDIERIQWLEANLALMVNSWVMITHDRQFADRMSNRIIELDRGTIRSYPGNLSGYYKQKEQQENAEQLELARLNKKLNQEEVWIRQGIKARRTRNEGRVRALKALRKQMADYRHHQGASEINFGEAQASGKRVLELKSVTKAYDGRTLFSDLDLTLLKGERLAVLGPNGSGKSTLVKIMLGEVEPDQGSVKLGTKLQIAYFDQSRAAINPDKTVFENIADGNDYIQIGDKSVHVMGHLQNYLFSPGRARSPASSLSGGEYSRLLIAKLMSQSFNLLVLDEPTNDLDLETLEILESQLTDYQGTLILISHDRQFIDNIATSVIHLDGAGIVSRSVGGYSDWLHMTERQQQDAIQQQTSSHEQESKSRKTLASGQPQIKKKLSYHEQRELEQLPEQIDVLEQQLSNYQAESQQSDFYDQSHEQVNQVFEQMSALESQINQLYQRWEQLSEQL